VCSDFRWRQCVISGKYAMVGTLGAGALVLVCLLLCVLRCMCCQKRKPKKEAKLHVFQREERAGLLSESGNSVPPSPSSSGLFYDSGRFDSRTPQTDRRREELRAKWGLKSSNGTINT